MSEISIISASTSGNSCPSSTVSTDISPDRTVVTFGFDAFQTYIGPGTSIMDHTKNCQIHLNLKYPGGFTFSVVESTYHGFAFSKSISPELSTPPTSSPRTPPKPPLPRSAPQEEVPRPVVRFTPRTTKSPPPLSSGLLAAPPASSTSTTALALLPPTLRLSE
ncbi:hypothetical protein MKZ38_010151 [Zalerion maritima]|uniref:Uncharacterized protein n=1 Tax=Zalerion maritima TaxID=339359 RepID=A0AAD5WSM3_9PEZI|nr:hypothetical protein MKZ38_010151 [Zalerion maritima]